MKRSLCQNRSVICLPIKTENLEVERKYKSHERRHAHQHRRARNETLLKCHLCDKRKLFQSLSKENMGSKIEFFKVQSHVYSLAFMISSDQLYTPNELCV